MHCIDVLDYTVKTAESGDYIINQINIPLNLEVLSKVIEKNDELIRSTGITKIFSDVRNSRNMISVADNYAFANNSNDNPAINSTTKIGILTSPGDDSHYNYETFALNAGFNVKIFNDYTACLNWLREE